MEHPLQSGRLCLACFAALALLLATVLDNITNQGTNSLTWCSVCPALSHIICLSGHRSSVHQETMAGAGSAVPGSFTRESHESLFCCPGGLRSLVQAIECTQQPPQQSHTATMAGAGSAVPCHFPRESQTRLYLCPGGLRSLVQVECTQPDNVWSDAAAISCSRRHLSHSTTLVVYIQDSVCSYSKVPWTYSLRDSCIAMTMILSDLSSQDAAESDYKQQHQHPSEDFVWCRCLCSQRLAEQSLHAYQPREWTCRFAILLFRPCTASILTSTVSAAPTSKGDAAHEPP